MATQSLTVKQQLESFHRFATEQLAVAGNSKLSLDELYDNWRSENPTPEEFAENVAAIQASIDDMNRGIKGRDAAEVEQELRQEYDLK